MLPAQPTSLNCVACGASFVVATKTLKRKYCGPECAKNQGKKRKFFVTEDLFREAEREATSSILKYMAERLGCTTATVGYQLRLLGLYCAGPGKGNRKRRPRKNFRLTRPLDRAEIRPRGCLICGEKRYVESAHLIPTRDFGHGEIGNIMPMCPTHHKLYDYRLLYPEEIEVLRAKATEWAGEDFARRAVEMHGAAMDNRTRLRLLKQQELVV